MRSRSSPVVAAAVLLLAGTARAAPEPARVHPSDRLLLERAVRVGRNTSARHVTPEGLLAYEHRIGATPAELSADALKKADTGIWSGCYAAALACRHRVAPDAVSLAEARRAAAGLDLLAAATGVEGCLARAVGRPIPGEERGKDVVDSPLGGGICTRRDPSRDTLSGVVLGWTCLFTFVDDPEVKAYARKNLGAIARRLVRGGMKLRDADGDVTKHGALDARVGPFENGMHAAIGSACVLAAKAADGGDDLVAAWRRLERDGWADAIDSQWSWLGAGAIGASNVNMVHLALLTICLVDDGKARSRARSALHDLRGKTRGWENGGYLACALLAGARGRGDLEEELRGALLRMRPEEVPWEGTRRRTVRDRRPIEDRPVNVWLWKADPFSEEVGRETARPSLTKTYTRADFLFAYWLARAAGALDPGPDAAPAPR
jgi:hypothetical protein